MGLGNAINEWCEAMGIESLAEYFPAWNQQYRTNRKEPPMATGSENDFDDDPYCAHCGESVSVKADCEFNEGDLCNECLYVEYPKMKRERDHLESLLAVAVAALRVCWSMDSVDCETDAEAEAEYLPVWLECRGLDRETFNLLRIGESEE